MPTSPAAPRGSRIVATYRIGRGTAATAGVSGLSETGCMIHADGSRLAKGEIVRLKLDEVGPLDGRVAVATAYSFIVEFVEPLHPAIAAMLAKR